MKTTLKLKTRITLQAITHVLRLPRYIVLAATSTLLMAGLIIWSLNLDLLRYILFEAPLTAYDKFEFFAYGYQSLFTTYNSALSLGIIVFTLLFGINIAMLTFAIRREGLASIPKKSGGGAFIFAILGGGCIACGTSLLAPLVASAGAASAPLLRDLGAIFNWLGSLLLIYSIYKLSLIVQSAKSTQLTRDKW